MANISISSIKQCFLCRIEIHDKDYERETRSKSKKKNVSDHDNGSNKLSERFLTLTADYLQINLESPILIGHYKESESEEKLNFCHQCLPNVTSLLESIDELNYLKVQINVKLRAMSQLLRRNGHGCSTNPKHEALKEAFLIHAEKCFDEMETTPAQDQPDPNETEPEIVKVEPVSPRRDEDVSVSNEFLEILNEMDQSNQELESDSNFGNRNEDQRERPHKCTICGAGFLKAHHRRRHETIHSGKKPYSCSFCNQSFRLKHKKNLHEVAVHKATSSLSSVAKMHECRFCGKAFPPGRRYQMISHERIHTGEKPYKCNFQFCDKAFRDKESLSQHERRHRCEERLFICGVEKCHKRFLTSGDCRSHQRSVHKLRDASGKVIRDVSKLNTSETETTDNIDINNEDENDPSPQMDTGPVFIVKQEQPELGHNHSNPTETQNDFIAVEVSGSHWQNGIIKMENPNEFEIFY